MNMITNIFAPHFSKLAVAFLWFFLRYVDRGCRRDLKKQQTPTKKTRERSGSKRGSVRQAKKPIAPRRRCWDKLNILRYRIFVANECEGLESNLNTRYMD